MIKAGSVLAAVLTLAGAGAASAYVGPSFVQIPGADGGWTGEQYKNAFKVDGNYWKVPARRGGSGGSGNRSSAVISGPMGPKEGAGTLVLALDKTNPVLPQFMERCVNKTPIAEMTYAESSELSRPSGDYGPRPDNVPAYFEYKLKDVRFSDCPVVADAPQQAIVVTFNGIERLNYKLDDDRVMIPLAANVLSPAPHSGTTRTFLMTWFASAHDVSDDQCPVLNAKPTEDDYYALMSKQDADKERAQLGEKGVSYLNGQMGLRGPNKLNVTQAPGIIRDPGHHEPKTTVARGLDLDGNDGTGAPAPGTCKHVNYVAPDGRTGIDNQLYKTQGCIPSFMGHKGFILQFANNQMRDGLFSVLVQVSGLDDARKDDNVDVTLFYSLDPMAKNSDGSDILPDYTFRVTDKPDWAFYTKRLHGRVADGVLTTDPVKEFRLNIGPTGTPREVVLADARMRIELLPDGKMKGVVAGYQDWRTIASRYSASQAEQVHNLHTPGLYNALKRNADGLKDPVTGECTGISSAFDIEGIPAFVVAPRAQKVAQAPSP